MHFLRAKGCLATMFVNQIRKKIWREKYSSLNWNKIWWNDKYLFITYVKQGVRAVCSAIPTGVETKHGACGWMIFERMVVATGPHHLHYCEWMRCTRNNTLFAPFLFGNLNHTLYIMWLYFVQEPQQQPPSCRIINEMFIYSCSTNIWLDVDYRYSLEIHKLSWNLDEPDSSLTKRERMKSDYLPFNEPNSVWYSMQMRTLS